MLEVRKTSAKSIIVDISDRDAAAIVEVSGTGKLLSRCRLPLFRNSILVGSIRVNNGFSFLPAYNQMKELRGQPDYTFHRAPPPASDNEYKSNLFFYTLSRRSGNPLVLGYKGKAIRNGFSEFAKINRSLVEK